MKHPNRLTALGAGGVAAGVATALVVALMSAGPAVARHTVARAHAASGVALTLEGLPVAQASGFNPFVPSSAASQLGATTLIYEPLFQSNTLKPGQYYPFLATKYAWSDNGKAVTFTIRKGVKWSNGTPLTPADVAYTYELIKRDAELNTTGITLTGVSTHGDTVTLRFPSPQYGNFFNIAASVYIVPKAIWSKVKNPATYADDAPVGTGPYTVVSDTASGIVMTANAKYWGGPFGGHGAPAVKTVEFPTLSSSTSALTAMLSGQLSWAGNFIRGVRKEFAGKPLVFWSPPTGTDALEPNLSRWPTNQLAVRKAISLAISRTALANQGEDGLESRALNASGLTLPALKPFLDPQVAHDTLSGAAQPAAAEKVLEAAGYKKNAQGWFALKGKVVALTLSVPTAFPDYAADMTLAAAELRKAGIDATFRGDSVNQWDAEVADGNFQMVEHWSALTTSPYLLYQGWLSGALDTKQNRAGNFEGLNNPAINRALNVLAASRTVAQQRKALVPIETYVANNLPVIPTVYDAAWGEYSTANFTGWPSPSNQYETAQPDAPTDEVVVLHLHPKS